MSDVLTDASIVARPLESALFGVAVASASVRSAADVAEVVAHLQRSPQRERTLLVVRVPADATAAVHALESAGALLCDVLVTYTRTVGPGGLLTWFEDEPGATVAHVRDAVASDGERLHALATHAFAGSSGHWHADARLRQQDASELYGRWAADLVSRASASAPLLVAESPRGVVGGFLALSKDEAGGWHVPLTAVDVDHRGKGLLRRMMYAASARIAISEPVRFHYETQLTNWAASHVVTSCGFAPVASRLTFHLWTDEP